MGEGLSDFIASAAGALLGALAAFQLEHWRRQRELRETRIEAGYRALSVLADMRDLSTQVYEKAIKPCRDDPRGWWEMRGISPPPQGGARLDVASLAFLLTRGKTEDLQALENALTAEKRFLAWLALLNLRNAKKDEAIELLQQESNPRALRTEGEIEDVLKIGRTRFLKTSFKALGQQYGELEHSLITALAGLHEALGRNLRGHEFKVPLIAVDLAALAAESPPPAGSSKDS